jgi:hypothetical protein
MSSGDDEDVRLSARVGALRHRLAPFLPR